MRACIACRVVAALCSIERNATWGSRARADRRRCVSASRARESGRPVGRLGTSPRYPVRSRARVLRTTTASILRATPSHSIECIQPSVHHCRARNEISRRKDCKEHHFPQRDFTQRQGRSLSLLYDAAPAWGNGISLQGRRPRARAPLAITVTAIFCCAKRKKSFRLRQPERPSPTFRSHAILHSASGGMPPRPCLVHALLCACVSQ